MYDACYVVPSGFENLLYLFVLHGQFLPCPTLPQAIRKYQVHVAMGNFG